MTGRTRRPLDGEFFALLAHDLRSPLASIRNAMQLWRMSGTSDPLLQKAGEIVDRQSVEIMRLLDDLLAAIRFAEGSAQLSMETADLVQIAAAALDAARPYAQARGRLLHAELPQQAVWVSADAAQMKRSLERVLEHAARSAQQGGDIQLSVGREGPHAHIRIRDTGAQMDGGELPYLFDLYPAASRALRPGLALARSVAQAHGGTLEARRIADSGGVDYVMRLAVLAHPADQPSPGTQRQPRAQSRRRIMVVDDSAAFLESLALLLEASGYEVKTAGNGDIALDTARAWQPEAALIDVNMPGMNGFEVARKLRLSFAPAAMKLVIMANDNFAAALAREIARGSFDAHVDKAKLDAAVLRKLLED